MLRFFQIFKHNANHGAAGSGHGGQFVSSNDAPSGFSDHLDKLGLSHFDTPDFAAGWKKHLKNVTPTEFIKGLFGTTDSSNLETLHTFGFEGNTLQIGSLGCKVHGAFAHLYDREFDFDKKSAHHALLQLDSTAQGGGAIKSLFTEAIPLYKKMGLEKITLNAGMDRGAYAWAKFGFNYADKEAEKNHTNLLKQKMKSYCGEGGEFLPDSAKPAHDAIMKVLNYQSTPNDGVKKLHNLVNISQDLTKPLEDHFKGDIIEYGDIKPTFIKNLLRNTNYDGVLNFNDSHAMDTLHQYINAKDFAQKWSEHEARDFHGRWTSGGVDLDDLAERTNYDLPPARYRNASPEEDYEEVKPRGPKVVYKTKPSVVDAFSRFKADGGLTNAHPEEMARKWEKLMGDVHPYDVLSAFMGKDGLHNHNFAQLSFHVNEEDKKVTIATHGEESSLDVHGKKAEAMTRILHLGKPKYAEHSLLKLTTADQGGDCVKKMFKACLPIYDKLGLNHITLHANIDGGAYAWARYGFEYFDSEEKNAHKKELDASIAKYIPKRERLSEEALGELEAFEKVMQAKGSRNIWNLSDMKTPELDEHFKHSIGKAFKKNGTFVKLLFRGADGKGTHWSGKMALDQKSPSRARLTQYIGK